MERRAARQDSNGYHPGNGGGRAQDGAGLLLEKVLRGASELESCSDSCTRSAPASPQLQLQPGLEALLQQIADDGAHLGVVTRNTPKAVDAFFTLLGGKWRERFSQVLTREYKYVKPDRRLLLHVAEQWGIHPSEMLMVGDSKEDVEVGALVGASTCLITGLLHVSAPPPSFCPRVPSLEGGGGNCVSACYLPLAVRCCSHSLGDAAVLLPFSPHHRRWQRALRQLRVRDSHCPRLLLSRFCLPAEPDVLRSHRPTTTFSLRPNF